MSFIGNRKVAAGNGTLTSGIQTPEPNKKKKLFGGWLLPPRGTRDSEYVVVSDIGRLLPDKNRPPHGCRVGRRRGAKPSVSCVPSSNRTCRFPASGSPIT